MGDNSLTGARHQRETVDSRDKSTARLYEMLGNMILSDNVKMLIFLQLLK